MWLLCSGRLQVLDVSWCSKADQTSVLFCVMCCVCVFLFWGVIWTPKLSKVFAKNSCLTKIRNDTSLLSIFEQLWPLSLVSRDSWSTSIKWIPHANNDTWTISHHKAWNLEFGSHFFYRDLSFGFNTITPTCRRISTYLSQLAQPRS